MKCEINKPSLGLRKSLNAAQVYRLEWNWDFEYQQKMIKIIKDSGSKNS